MSKRGSHVLRYALVNAAHNVVKNNATFKAYYDAKRAEGRTHYNALGHCAGKLVRVIWKMLTDEVEFNLEKEVCIPISIDFEKAPLVSIIKVTLFYHRLEK